MLPFAAIHRGQLFCKTQAKDHGKLKQKVMYYKVTVSFTSKTILLKHEIEQSYTESFLLFRGKILVKMRIRCMKK